MTIQDELRPIIAKHGVLTVIEAIAARNRDSTMFKRTYELATYIQALHTATALNVPDYVKQPAHQAIQLAENALADLLNQQQS